MGRPFSFVAQLERMLTVNSSCDLRNTGRKRGNERGGEKERDRERAIEGERERERGGGR